MYKVYILFSEIKNRFYIGFTGDDINNRLRKHNSNHKGYTGTVADWKIVWLKDDLTEIEARKLEKEIKGWKRRSKIEKLVNIL